MIAVSALAKSYGPQTLFRDVSFQLVPPERYGLVGANGSGKSTLMRLLATEEPPNEGTVAVPKRLRVGLLRQDHFRFESERILDVVLMGHGELWEAMRDKERLLDRADQEFDAERYAALEDVILHHDGYSVEARAAEILEGLGIPAERHQEPLSALSGGFKLRVLLAQTLASRPDALLLDEPTNHLDILSIRWLEKFLEEFPGVVVVISHDHRFLDNVCTQILDVDYETVTLYPGNYTSFTEAKVANRERKETEIGKREREIAHHKAFVDRFRAKATKARQAKSKQKLIDRIVLEPLPQSSRRYPVFRFEQCRPAGKEVLRLEGVDKAFAGHSVLRDVSLKVRRGDRVAILGPNGIGKSTLLKVAVGVLPADRGTVTWGYETYPGYFPQDHRERFAERRQTVEAWLWDACPNESMGFVRNRLGQVLFSGDEAAKRVSALSGGEAARLLFARLAVERPNVLVLDEPTNHLDLEAIEALVAGLKAYDGTLLLVSHDRWFVSEVANRIVEVRAAGLDDYRGTYEEFVAHCGDDHLDGEATLLRVKRERRRERTRRGPEGEADRQRARELARRRDDLTAAIAEAERRVHDINETFCDPTYFERAPREEVRRLERDQQRLASDVERMMQDWVRLEEELETLGGAES